MRDENIFWNSVPFISKLLNLLILTLIAISVQKKNKNDEKNCKIYGDEAIWTSSLLRMWKEFIWTYFQI